MVDLHDVSHCLGVFFAFPYIQEVKDGEILNEMNTTFTIW